MHEDELDDWEENTTSPGVLSKTLRNVGFVILVCLVIAFVMGSSG